MPEMFTLSMSLWELAARATLVYLSLVFLVRVIPKRDAGNISPNDILRIVIVGGLGTDAILGGSSSVLEILLMVGLVLAWGYVLDLLEYRFPVLRRLFRDRQTKLIENGRILRQNLRREMITEEELFAVLRKNGLDDPTAIRSAYLEADGEISLIKKLQ